MATVRWQIQGSCSPQYRNFFLPKCFGKKLVSSCPTSRLCDLSNRLLPHTNKRLDPPLPPWRRIDTNSAQYVRLLDRWASTAGRQPPAVVGCVMMTSEYVRLVRTLELRSDVVASDGSSARSIGGIGTCRQ